MKAIIRKERSHLFAPSINIAVMCSLSGRIEDSILLGAIGAAVDNNEVLSSKITFDVNGDVFYETKLPTTVSIQRFEGEWEDKVVEQEKAAFDLLSGELIRFFVKREGETTQLLLIAHHLVGDGLSLTYFVKDVLDVLNGRRIKYKRLIQYDMENLPSDSKLNLFMRLMLRGINKRWNKTGKVFSFSEYESMYRKYWESHETKIISAKLRESQLDQLEKEAKLHSITINSILATVLTKASGEVLEIGIPVSLRKKGNPTMANYSTAISIRYKYDEEKSFWENAELIHRFVYLKLRDSKSKYFLTQFMNGIAPTLIDAAYFAAFDGYENKVARNVSNMFGYMKAPEAVNLSNLTRIELNKDYLEYQIKDFYFVPPIVPNASSMMGVVTHNNEMVITIHALMDEQFEQKKRFFERTVELLNSI